MISGKKVAAVDSDGSLCYPVRFFLRDTSFWVETYTSTERNNEKTRDFIKNFKPDILILDYFTGDTTALDICRSEPDLKVSGNTEKIIASPVLLYPEISRKILGLGMKFLRKPFLREDLLRTIVETAEKRGKRIEDIENYF
ncbi:MAG: hypothetical protein ACLFQK_01385 [Fibrobacterota bacterium]